MIGFFILYDMSRKKTLVEFIKEANQVHNSKYEYSKVDYANNKKEICIICPIHGEFYQSPISHLKGKGCQKCNGGVRDTTEVFIEKARKIHGDKYDYSKVEYKNSHTNVCIICPKHGEFMQIPNNHLCGNGCKKCRTDKMKEILSFDKQQFIERSNAVHNGKYDYSKIKYINAKTPIEIICPLHGIFKQIPDNHLKGCGCPKCGKIKSKPEEEIIEILKPLECEQGNRKILDGKEIDVYIPSLKIGIEYNGLLWHSESYGKDKYYHLDKLNECEKKGVKLIQIFEDEWVNHRDVCEYNIRSICGLKSGKYIPKDEYEIKDNVNKVEANEFIEKYCINKNNKFSVSIGCYYNKKLFFLTIFRKINGESYIVNNIAIDTNYNGDNLLEAVLKYFIANYEFNAVKIICDRRWVGDVYDNFYTKIGFKVKRIIPPSFMYYNPYIKQFYRFSKNEMNKIKAKINDSKNVKKYETKIWDCGKIEYCFLKNASGVV